MSPNNSRPDFDIAVEQAALFGALRRLSSITPPPTNDRRSDILWCVHGKASGGQLTLTQTDLECFASIAVRADGEGEFTTDSATLRAVAEKLAPGRVELTLGDRLGIAAGKGRRNLPTLRADAFPILPEIEVERVTLAADHVRGGLSRVEAAIDRSGVTVALSGARLRLSGGRLTFVGFRQPFVVTADTDTDTDTDTDIIIPRAAVSAMLNILPESGSIRFATDNRRAAFAFDGGVIVTKLVDGRQPDANVGGFSRTLRGGADDLIAAIDAVSVAVAEVRERPITIDLNDGCTVRGGNAHCYGEWRTEAEHDGAPIQLDFAAKLALDALAQFKGRRVEWRMGGPFDPTLVTSPELPGVRAVVFPRLPERMSDAA